MEIYHTETQADYDALMVELEEQGCKWASGRKPTESKDWVDHKEKTGVVIEKRITRACIRKLKFDYPDIPIIKYKAKADEKMRFTKENVEKVIDEYFWQADFEPCGDLIAEIHNLDDKPEKVVVPKSVALFYENVKHYKLEEVFNQFEKTSDKEVSNWYFNQKGRYDNNIANAQETIAKIHLYGYTIEKEPQYIISIMDLGIDRIILMKNKLGYSVELESENDGHWEVHFTEQQIKEYDKRYWAFAVPVEEMAK